MKNLGQQTGLTVDTGGLHPSTEACLQAMQILHDRRDFARILDLGCGKGILSIVAAHIWNATVTAVDISSEALEDAKREIEGYGLSQRISTVRSDGFSATALREKAPFDL